MQFTEISACIFAVSVLPRFATLNKRLGHSESRICTIITGVTTVPQVSLMISHNLANRIHMNNPSKLY